MPVARSCIAFLVAAAVCTPAFASTADKPGAGPWSGSAELGGVVTTGNSSTSSLDGKFHLGYVRGPWTTDLHLGVLHASAAGTTTANRLFGDLSTRHTLDADSYVFGNLRGTHDSFSGYRYQTSAALGLGRQLIHTSSTDLRAEIGPGYRLAQIDGGATQRDAIVRVHGVFSYRFTSKAHFDQTLTTIAGTDDTELESVTALTTDITGALALKLSYTVLHNTIVPLGRKKTDTFTSVNLVYSF